MIETLGDILRHNAHKFADEPAYIRNDAPVSFAALFERAQKLAAALWAIGLRPQDRLAIYSQNTLEFMQAYAACELTGYIASGVNWRLAAPEIAGVLADARPRVLAFEAQYAGIVEQIRAAAPFIETFLCFGGAVPDWARDYHQFTDGGDPAGAPARSTADQIVHLIYTSGTTGRPKGVMRTQAGEVAAALLFAAECGFTISERLQISMPLFHVGARYLQMGAHARGGCVVLHHEFRAAEIARAIAAHQVTATHMAPTMVQALLDLPDIDAVDLSSLRTIVYSAAPMPTPLLRRGLARLGPVFLQLYGMTEGAGTTLHKRQHRLDGSAADQRRLGSVGQAAPSVDIRIVDEAGRDLPLGSPGEIAIRTDTRMLGYWNNTAATVEALKDGWYATGDVGFLDEAGFLYLVDRKKDMIVSGGENIYSREVEEALAAHPSVRDAAVIGVADPYWGEAVHAVVVVEPDRPVSAEALIDHCRSLIASYKKPKSIAFVDDLPRLPSGKIDKVRLREVYRGTDES
jgi:acyl-CoA synthetase (AMP-forming)/AMP-acid ligase II